MRDEIDLAIHAERVRQHERWGEQNFEDGTGGALAESARSSAQLACSVAAEEGRCTWRHVLEEEVSEVLAETDPSKLREELIQVGAVCKQWVEAIDRRRGGSCDGYAGPEGSG